MAPKSTEVQPEDEFVLDLEAELPEIEGRGREARPVPEKLAKALADMVEAGKGTITKTGTQSEINRFKSDVAKFQKADPTIGKPVYRTNAKNPDGSPSKLKTNKDNPGTAKVTLTVQVRRVEATAR